MPNLSFDPRYTKAQSHQAGFSSRVHILGAPVGLPGGSVHVPSLSMESTMAYGRCMVDVSFPKWGNLQLGGKNSKEAW